MQEKKTTVKAEVISFINSFCMYVLAQVGFFLVGMVIRRIKLKF